MMIGLLGTCFSDGGAVAMETSRMFSHFQKNHDDMKSLPSDMRSLVFSTVLKNGGEYQEVKAYFSATTDLNASMSLGFLGILAA